MSTAKARPPKFRLGDWVTFQRGVRPVFAQVIEDRGPLGVGGRRIYRIRLDRELNEPMAFEMPEDEMEKAVPDRAAILRYLKQGGLVDILLTNTQGGPPQNQPRVWLTFSRRGEVSHTLSADRGLMGGGAVVPFWVLDENGILPHKKPEVRTFLEGLGLTREEAEEVMEAVGTGGPAERRFVKS